MVKRIWIISLIVKGIYANAQVGEETQWRISAIGSPVLSKISAPALFEYKATGSFLYGAELSAQYGDFWFGSGLFQIRQGSLFQVEETTVQKPEGNGKLRDVYILNNSLALPLLAEYRVFDFRGTSLWFGGGGYVGYTYKEFYSDNLGKPNLFDDLYTAITVGMRGRWEFNHRWGLSFRPAFTYQIRRQDPSKTFNFRMWFISTEVGFCYKF